ncbi:hypothetical protein L596_028138 [Steinernema carpocapsae]|uniref:Pentatricopeptide repeat-containing protein-mitochondrial domain-containing protein n=1 Tax=Steinernema carpocapsae TaxID=34508 RepID=A0A4U5LXJ7_STECR|nr:hypothetical protein L596_028138 [Steinernema carpocapsae]
MALMEKHRKAFSENKMRTFEEISEGLAWQDYVVQGVLDRINAFHLRICVWKEVDQHAPQPTICPPEQIYQADRKVRSHHGDLDPKLVASRLENEQDVDALAVLEELDSANIEPTADTFAFLAEAFAVKGDINGVKSVVSLMKDSGIPVSEKVLQSMVYALTHSGDRTQAAGVIKAFESHASISAFNLRLAEIRALAALGDLQGVVEVVADIASDQRMKTSDTQALLMHALCQLVIKGKHDAVERLKPFITRFSEESKEPGMAEKVYLLRLLRETLVKRDYESAAVLDSLFGSSFEDSRTFTFMKHLKSSVNDRNVEPSTLYKRSSIVKSLGHGEQPFLVVMERALIENNRKLFNDLYSLLVVDEDFTEMLVERPHLAYPLAVKLVNQIHSAASVEVKSQKCLELCKLLFSQSQGIDFDAANNFVFRAVEKDLKHIGDLAHCKQFRNSIACSIVDRMMMRSKNQEKLLELLEGPLNPDSNVRFYANRIVRRLVGFLKSDDVSGTTLKLATKVVASAFVDQQSGAGFDTVSMLLRTASIPEGRISELVSMWSEDSRISLNGEEVSKLEKDLLESKLPARAKLVKQLKRKSKAVVRWMETEDIAELEKEAENLSDAEKGTKAGVLARLYGIIISKRASESPKDLALIAKWGQKLYSLKEGDEKVEGHNLKVYKTLCASFEEALEQSKENEICDEFWKIPLNYNGVYGLMYALNLCCRDKFEEAKEVIAKLKATHNQSMVIGAINRLCDAATDVDEHHLKQFVDMLASGFALPINLRKKLLLQAKTNTLTHDLRENANRSI